MVRSVRWFGAALIVAGLASAADAQTQPAPGAEASARRHHRKAQPQPDGHQITVQKATPSWLTLGTDASVGTGNNYVTSTFDQPSTVQGTFQGYRGRERIVPQYGVPGATLFQF